MSGRVESWIAQNMFAMSTLLPKLKRTRNFLNLRLPNAAYPTFLLTSVRDLCKGREQNV